MNVMFKTHIFKFVNVGFVIIIVKVINLITTKHGIFNLFNLNPNNELH